MVASSEGSIVEYANFDNESKQFISPDENVQIKYNILTRELVIIGKQYHNVQFEYIKHTLSLGVNDLGVELTDRKLLTAAAVKKLIDNNLKHSLQNHTDSLTTTLSNYMTKTSETTLTLNNGSETSNRKLVIHPVNDNQFSISLFTPAEKRMINFVVGAVDFGYNQVRLQNLVINGRSIQSVIKSDDSNDIIASDMSIYTAATVDKVINDSLTTTLVNYALKTEIPEIPEFDLSGYTTNDSLTNTLTNYRKIDDLIVDAQSLPIGSIDSFTESSSINFENITTASVEYSDEIHDQGVTFIGTFVCVADESIRYDFEIAYKSQVTLFALLKTMQISATYDPPANKFYWAMTSGGLWLGTGKGSDGFRPTYRVILKSAIVGPFDSLVLKSQLDEYVPSIDSINDAFSNSDMNPGMTPEAWIFNDSFEYTDDHVLSSQATKLLVDKTVRQSNTTITHYTPIEAGEDITKYEVGKPVFLSGHVYKYVNSSWISSTSNDSTDCICSVKINGTWKEYIGIITSIDVKNNCITFATHGDMLFKVDDANIYQIGDVILYDGRIVDEDYAMTLRIQQSIAGKITAKINETTVAIFKY